MTILSVSSSSPVQRGFAPNGDRPAQVLEERLDSTHPTWSAGDAATPRSLWLFASPLRLRAGVLLLALLALSAGAAWNFDTILKNAEQRYGNLGTAKTRIESWGRLIDDSENLDEMAKLKAVNAFFNGALVFTDDRTVWHQEDYWATPVESLYKAPATARTTPSPSSSLCAASGSPATSCASPTSRRCSRTRRTWCSPTTPPPLPNRWCWTT